MKHAPPPTPNTSHEPLWFERPLDERRHGAAVHAGMAIGSLVLSTRASNCLKRAHLRYADVGALMLADSGIVHVRNMGIKSLRDIDAALAPLFAQVAAVAPVDRARQVVAELDARARWHAALAALGANADLAGHALRDVGWPDHLIALCPNDAVSGLADLSPAEADTLWTTLAMRPALRDAMLMAIEALTAVPTGLDAEGWADRWRSLGLTVLPEGFTVGGGMGLVEAITQVVRHVVSARHARAEWTILQHRYGLAGAERLTLREVGEALGLTRERIRQREAKSLKALRAWMDQPDMHLAPSRLHPALATCLRDLAMFFAEVRAAPTSDEAFARRCHAILHTDAAELDPIISLLAELDGVAEISLQHRTLRSVWASDELATRAAIRRRVLQLDAQLRRRSAAAFTDEALAAAIDARAKGAARITVAEVRAHVGLCSTIEQLPDGRYQGRLGALSWSQLPVRFLSEAGQPLHIDEILRRINLIEAAHGGRTLSRSYLSSLMSSHRHLAPIGRSGYWALVAWTNVETGTVRELMVRCLAEHARPMTPDEIYAWMHARRPVSIHSITIYLSDKARFAKVDGGRWVLAD